MSSRVRTNTQSGCSKERELRREHTVAVLGVSPSPLMTGLCPAGRSGLITHAHMSVYVGVGCPPS